MSFYASPQPDEDPRRFLSRWYDQAEQQWGALKSTGSHAGLKAISVEILESLRKVPAASFLIRRVFLQGEQYPARSMLHVFPDLRSVDEGLLGEAYQEISFLSSKKTREILRHEHKQMWHRRYELDMLLEQIEPLLRKRPPRRKPSSAEKGRKAAAS